MGDTVEDVPFIFCSDLTPIFNSSAHISIFIFFYGPFFFNLGQFITILEIFLYLPFFFSLWGERNSLQPSHLYCFFLSTVSCSLSLNPYRHISTATFNCLWLSLSLSLKTDLTLTLFSNKLRTPIIFSFCNLHYLPFLSFLSFLSPEIVSDPISPSTGGKRSSLRIASGFYSRPSFLSRMYAHDIRTELKV